MAISTVVKTKRDGKLTLKDNGGANTLEVAYEAGDFNLTIPGPAVVNNLDRGKFGANPSLRYSDDQAMTATFSAMLRDLSDAAYATLEEVIMQSGLVGSGWVSTGGANAEVFTLDVTFDIEGTGHGDANDHSLTLPNCVVTGSIAEGDPDTISISITSYSNFPTAIS